MNAYLILLLIPPLIVVVIYKIKCPQTVTWREALVQAAVALLLVGAVWGASRWNQFHDTEIINGKVTGKEQVWVPCSHSYSCHCRTVYTGSGKNRHSTTKCDTCYRHNNDWDWRVYTTVGNFEVERVDSRGEYEPARWTVVQKDQPAAREHDYTNYIKAAPASLFHMVKNDKMKVPNYPHVYDYQYADHAVVASGNVPNLPVWNVTVANALRDLGPAKQANIILVFTNASESFADALRANWLGGKKNDLIVVMGTDYPTIKWVRVFSWAKHDIVNISIRNELIESKTLDPAKTVGIVSNNVQRYYERRPMADFKYLADQAVPSAWVMIIALILGTGVAVFLGRYFHENDCF